MTAVLTQISGSSLRRGSPRLSVSKVTPSRDAPILRELLDLHALARPRVLDCTYGRGLIWGRLPIRREVIKVDVNSALPDLDLVCDWLELPQHVGVGWLDVLVWDPIQVSDVGKSSKMYWRYVATENEVRGPVAVSAMFEPFLRMAAQIVKPKTGIVLAKMCDQVHNGRYQWQVFELIAEAHRQGWTACQPRVVFNPSLPPVPGIKRQWHTRNNVAWWLVLRNGPACHGPGRRVRYDLTCASCNERFPARRPDARTCSNRCRLRWGRRPRDAGE